MLLYIIVIILISYFILYKNVCTRPKRDIVVINYDSTEPFKHVTLNNKLV